MFDLFTIALFQLATLFGSAPATLNDSTDPAPTTQSTDTTVGSGGWGHDITTPPAPTPPTCNLESTVGSGGWGHD